MFADVVRESDNNNLIATALYFTTGDSRIQWGEVKRCPRQPADCEEAGVELTISQGAMDYITHEGQRNICE